MKPQKPKTKLSAGAAERFNAVSVNEPPKWRLTCNLILPGAKFLAADTMIEDITIIPVDLRQYCVPDDVPDLDTVKLLVSINYFEPVQVRGEIINIQTTREAGSILTLSQLPEKTRETLIEGQHYSRSLDAEPDEDDGLTPYEKELKDQAGSLHIREY